MHDQHRIALYPFLGFPETIFSKIHQTSTFCEAANGITEKSGFQFAENASISDVLDAARKGIETGNLQTFKDLNYQPVTVTVKDGWPIILPPSGIRDEEEKTPLLLGLLLADADARIEILNDIITFSGPSGPNRERWEPILKERQPTNLEILKISHGMRSSGNVYTNRFTVALDEGSFSLQELIPESSAYLTASYGPLPDTPDAAEYIQNQLLVHREKLCAQNLIEGFRLVLLGSINEDIPPPNAVAKIGDDELLEIVNCLKLLNDPFTLLGLTEICAARSAASPEFYAITESLVERLIGSPQIAGSNHKSYNLFSALADFSLRAIQAMDGLANLPPYWHRLCAFMHAGLILEILEQFEFEEDLLIKDLSNFVFKGQQVANAISLRKEPAWHQTNLDPEYTQGEILGRLGIIWSRLLEQEIEMPGGKKISEALTKNDLRAVTASFPGPMQGHASPTKYAQQKAIPDDPFEAIISSLISVPTTEGWGGIYRLGMAYSYSEDQLSKLAETISGVNIQDMTADDLCELLIQTSMIANRYTHVELAESSAGKIMEGITSNTIKDSVALMILLHASGAKSSDWDEWLAAKLTEMTYRFSRDAPSVETKLLLEDLKQKLPISEWKLGRVEALWS